MGKTLVIVESPAKAKTINKYLGNQYVVKSSVGHIRDLPTSGSAQKSDPKERAKQAALTRKLSPEQKVEHKKRKQKEQLIARMGIDPNKDWAAHYEILPGKEKVVDELRKLAKSADQIYLATDLDREGEAIAWHLREAIGGDDSRYRRVVFNEITKKAINEAFEKPSDLDLNRVNAQQARRFLDRVVGYMVSPLLWEKVARGLSAGRVQSVAVRLVVEREREIRAFIPDEYWELHADAQTQGDKAVRLEVVKQAGAAFKPTNEDQAMAAVKALQSASYEVVNREDRPTSSKPSAPFITSTLQQAASTRLGFGVKKTMMLAQRLYEAGYITYMRTDSTNLSNEAVEAAREFIGSQFGGEYLPPQPIRYSSKEGAQEAHEAIRPSDVNVTSDTLNGVDADAVRLYDLIRNQFLACQMTPARYLSTRVTVKAGAYELTTKGRVLQFDGYTRVMNFRGKSDEDQILPDMQVGESLTLKALDPSQHFTKPAPRYTEASLVKELEKRGIGRPSTYAAIISTIQDRGYVEVQNRRFYAQKMGDIVTDRLAESFPDLMDFSFTARMEEKLDDVADGDINWKDLLNNFYTQFEGELEAAQSADGGMRANDPTETDISCPACQRPMMIRTATTGVFLGCSGYALPPKERCKTTINLIPGDEVVAVDADDEAESRLLLEKHRCGKCGSSMDSYLIDEKRKLHICGNNPDCDGFEVEEGNYRIKGYEGPVVECDKCSAEMHLKTGRFGKFFGCTNSECKNTRKLLKNGEVAPPKMDPVPMPELKCQKVDDTYILRDGASGLFLAASQFPRNRETRAPLVKELIPHKNAIDPKYHFLMEGPQQDEQGNPAQIRYSRKTKEQYLMTEVDGKATGWRAYFTNGMWQIEAAKAKKR
ncbi:DNA topoisomerase 1 [Marinobacterium sp. xm-a-121]|uniref:type I DNA topoisomerase n=1 Tax=unclassified Marinobacterium TaxID=2644139 RepID=UPI001569A92F|nr:MULTISPECIES: type I DNA topoisomerase [unclassified Marinobacterium]NRP09738.1 DNA topoisomerase 1 [Marinobacterium sp. xm-g-48]NRP38971.1 DNA topoisomerase 1 [Marinobacterium sp. xm-a-121]NRP51822.1 DNA topoisomerase 1 [Marinobacterium sp. xm-v-242]NRP76403.1 DNA topoisomerase 1 [Marinobacterium sp. xm-m-383]NRP82583.1 DNA topoisomerase 1 [Marinobacterium sp. xm-d-509]